MNTTRSRWFLIWAVLLCVPSTAMTQDSTKVLPPEAADDFSAESMPIDTANSCEASDSRSALGRWWHERMKPCLQYSHWGYANEFEEVPFGASLVAAQQVQVWNGWADRLVLYRYDFCEGSALLNPAGIKRLNEIAVALCGWAHVLRIEPTPNKPQLDDARKQHVMQLLARAGVTVPVEIGTPAVSGMAGDEARTVNELMMIQIRAGGQMPASGSTGASIVTPPGFAE